MPVMAIYRSSDVDRAKYDAVVNEIGAERDPPEGAVVHLSGFGDAGICVVEVWESREAMEGFAKDRLGAVLDKFGISSTPEILDLHKAIATDAIDEYKVTGPEPRTAFREQASAPPPA